MAEVWPPSLPQRFASITQGEGEGSIRSETDAGPGKVRRRFSATRNNIQGTMLMNVTQINTLRAFWRTTLLQGSEDFTMPDPYDSDPLNTVTVRFKEPPTWTNEGPVVFIVTLNLLEIVV